MKTKNYQGILFDLDGTLLDSWPAIRQALFQTCFDYGQTVNETLIDRLRASCSISMAYLISQLFPQQSKSQQQAMTSHAINIYRQVQQLSVNLFDGIETMLLALEQRKLPWGIVTNKPKSQSKQLAQRIEILSAASCLLCPEDVLNPKPHPAPILTACQQLMLSPYQVLYIGDTLTDRQAAKAAWVDCLLCLYSYDDDEILINSQPEMIVSSVAELHDHLMAVLDNEDFPN